MERFCDDFGPFEGRIWLNSAHQGPLPHAAIKAAQEALALKIAPHRIRDDFFDLVPKRLKRALGRLIGAPAEDIILGNSTSYGLHLLANGITWQAGDEVLLVENDFPASILPWLGLRKRGVVIRTIRPQASVLQADELRLHLSESTRLLCISWVNSFTGGAVDVLALSEVCRAAGITFVLNGSQAIGTRTLNISTTPVDAVTSCGSKWLCGPYGTGFCWIKPELRESLEYNQAYWLTTNAESTLRDMSEAGFTYGKDLGAAVYDVFCTANFLNFMPWTAAVEYLLLQGICKIEAHNSALVSRIIEGLDEDKYELISPPQEPARSTLVVLTRKYENCNTGLYQTLKGRGIDISIREGNLRLSPHLYNTAEEIDYVLSELDSFCT